jgi:hypothetical protein
MWRFAFVAFMIAHGGVHAAIWITPKPKDGSAPFDPSHSWILGDHRALAVVVALVAGALLVTAGIGLWAHAEWWRLVAVGGLGVSFALMVVFFHPWFLFIQVVNAGLIVTLVLYHWPTKVMVGA